MVGLDVGLIGIAIVIIVIDDKNDYLLKFIKKEVSLRIVF